MSLSGQYLEELSRRYKKQVEELQISFAKTLVNIEEQNKQSLERKEELLKQNQKLRNDLEILTERIFSWQNIMLCCICFTCVQIFIFHIILKIWGRKYGLEVTKTTGLSSEMANVGTLARERKSGNVPMKFRRKSAEEKHERIPMESSSLHRRPSTEALNIIGTYTELLIDDSDPARNSSSNFDYHLIGKEAKNAYNNKSTSSEIHEADISGYVKIEDLKDLYDKPAEDEYEFYGATPDLKKDSRLGSQGDYDCGSDTTIDLSVDSLVPFHQKKSKVIKNKYKNRRLSSPTFFKSPFSIGPTAQSTGWEWHRSKKPQKSSQINRKAKSESPPSPKQNGITDNNNSAPANINSINLREIQKNDSTRSSIDDRKTSGSFKRILKKIF